VDLPLALRIALAAELRSRDSRELARATEVLVERYRGGREQGAALVRSEEEVAAYAAYRMPATYAALVAALGYIRDQWPGTTPTTLLDAGAGPGTGMWAAREVWPEIERVTMLERDARMLALGQRLAAHAPDAASAGAVWRQADLLGGWEVEPHDLVVCAYVLNEVPEDKRAAVVARLWAAARAGLVLLEPGTPAGFAVIREARRQLIAAGGTVLAPCPHDGECPLPENDWCHAAQRISRTRLQRVAKGGTLPFEDEKFSYVAVGHSPAPAIAGRVIRRPEIHTGRVVLQLCTPEGLRTEMVTRNADRARFREARDLAWGDALLPEDDG
jgi:ribosomal protein RSM22 (predicted rRNA methylase)